MAWQNAVDSAQKWLQDSGKDFTLTSTNIEARLIHFRAPQSSFFVTVPEKQGIEEWMVWSDDENCVQRLSDGLEYICQPKRTLYEVLERAAKCLKTDSEETASGMTNENEDNQAAEDDEEDEEEEGDDDDAYDYDMDDPDLDFEVNEKKENVESEVTADDFFTGQGSPIAVHRLISDLKSLQKSDGKFGISGGPRGDNLFLWDVELSNFEKGTLLYKDLESYAHTYKRKPILQLEMKFPKDYPMCPPFVRLIRPRFKFLTGHVTVGGSICMELLTRSGWLSTNDIEGILIQVRAEIMSDSHARLASNPDTEYTEDEAKAAFERMVQRYGWNRQRR